MLLKNCLTDTDTNTFESCYCAFLDASQNSPVHIFLLLDTCASHSFPILEFNVSFVSTMVSTNLFHFVTCLTCKKSGYFLLSMVFPSHPSACGKTKMARVIPDAKASVTCETMN